MEFAASVNLQRMFLKTLRDAYTQPDTKVTQMECVIVVLLYGHYTKDVCRISTD